MTETVRLPSRQTVVALWRNDILASEKAQSITAEMRDRVSTQVEIGNLNRAAYSLGKQILRKAGKNEIAAIDMIDHALAYLEWCREEIINQGHTGDLVKMAKEPRPVDGQGGFSDEVAATPATGGNGAEQLHQLKEFPINDGEPVTGTAHIEPAEAAGGDSEEAGTVEPKKKRGRPKGSRAAKREGSFVEEQRAANEETDAEIKRTAKELAQEREADPYDLEADTPPRPSRAKVELGKKGSGDYKILQ